MEKISDCDIVTKEDALNYLINDYHDYDLDIIFAYHTDHPIYIDNLGRYRWLQTIEYDNVLGNDPNQMSMKYHDGEMTQKEYMNYNRQIGYTIYGFWEIFVFNNRFDEHQYEKDMEVLKIKKRNKTINKIIK